MSRRVVGWMQCRVGSRCCLVVQAAGGAGGLHHPSACSGAASASLGVRLGRALVAPLNTCSSAPQQQGRWAWQPGTALQLPAAHTAVPLHPRQQPLLHSRHLVAALSSFASASDLSAAVAAAPTLAALQGLAASAASTPHQAWLVQQYKAQLLPGLELVPADGLVKALLFFATLGPGHAELFEQAVPVLYNRLGQLTPHELVALASAYAAAAQHSPSAYSQELFAALTEFLWEGLGGLSPAGLADVADAYAAVDHYHDDDDFFGGLAAAARQQLEAFCPEDLSRLVLGLARLRFAAHDLNNAALQQMAAQLEGWSLSSIGRVLQAVATVQTEADPCMLERVATHVSNVLRNLRTSTDGKSLLTSLPATGAPAAAAAAGDGSALPGTLPGLAGSSSSSGSNTRLGPSWQGFGMTRSSSSSSTVVSDGSGAASVSSSSAVGAASIWAAANSSSGMYEYAEEGADTVQQQQPASPPLQQQQQAGECELGPDFITVTSYGTDGSVTKTYIKKPGAAAQQQGGSGMPSATPGRLPTARGLGAPTGSSGRSWQKWRVRPAAPPPSQPLRELDECPAPWEWAGSGAALSSDCRPQYDDAASLAGGLVSLVWAFAMLGHAHGTMAKEAFKALSLVAPAALSEEQLAMLWGAHMRYQQLGHVMLDPNPLLAESYSVFARELSRAAPRTIALPNSLQPLAAASWLLESTRAAPEYRQPQPQHAPPYHQTVAAATAASTPLQDQQQQQQLPAGISSWRFRDPAVLSAAGLEASVRAVLTERLGLHVDGPLVTLDGLERVGMRCKHNGVNVAWQVVPPAWCTRNAPHAPTVAAAAQRWALAYRGYAVLQVPFHEWAAVLNSGDVAVQAGYLQRLLDGVPGVRARNVPNF